MVVCLKPKKYFYYGYVSLFIPLRNGTFTIYHIFILCSTRITTYIFLAAFKNITQALHFDVVKCRWHIVVFQ